MNYLHGDYESQKGLLKKKKTNQQTNRQLVIWFRQMQVRNVFVLISGNEVPQLSKDALVVGESLFSSPVPVFCLSFLPLFLPPFCHRPELLRKQQSW